jgi:hypothetical protein
MVTMCETRNTRLKVRAAKSNDLELQLILTRDSAWRVVTIRDKMYYAKDCDKAWLHGTTRAKR